MTKEKISLTRKSLVLVVIATLVFGMFGGVLITRAAQTPTATPTEITIPKLVMDELWLAAVNVTDRLLGDFTGLPLTGTSLDTGQGANELFAMNQDIQSTDPVTFTTVDTGQGANELFDMDQNVLVTSDVNFSSVEADEFYSLSVNVTQSLWDSLGATAYVGLDDNRAYQENYFYCDGANDYVQFQQAIDYLATITDAGMIHIEQGQYDMGGNITFTGGDRIIFKGEGIPSVVSLPTSGGTMLNFENDEQINSGAAARIQFEDIGFNFGGTYTRSCIDLYDEDQQVCSYRSYYRVRATVPSGSGTNPSGTPNGVCLFFGEVNGPPAREYVWRDNVFVDGRQGANSDNTLAGWVIEGLVFEGNYININHAAGLVTPNMFYIAPVCYATIRDFTGYTDATYAGQYEHQWLSTGGNKNFWMQNVGFLANADVSDSHFSTSGSLYVYGYNPHQLEGGTSPIDPSIGGGGTVYIRFNGRGYEVEDSATILNGNTNVNVTHGLVGTPTFISVTGTNTDADLLYVTSVGATTFQIIAADGAVGGDRTIYYKAICTKTG